jgi:hypothetical protein
MKKTTERFMWLFERLYEAGSFRETSRNGELPQIEWSTSGLSVGSLYDADCDLLDAFRERFPGRDAGDGGIKAAKSRLGRLFNEAFNDGWIDRTIRGNQLEYFGEGQRWDYVYRLPAEYAIKIKNGRETPESLARRYQGDKS